MNIEGGRVPKPSEKENGLLEGFWALLGRLFGFLNVLKTEQNLLRNKTLSHPLSLTHSLSPPLTFCDSGAYKNHGQDSGSQEISIGSISIAPKLHFENSSRNRKGFERFSCAQVLWPHSNKTNLAKKPDMAAAFTTMLSSLYARIARRPPRQGVSHLACPG